ncbi:MAG: DUF4105 domain-containing protein [Spirochaetaceae bacterium]|jgi:hypothetical protein|nr:DUF4105 domain-containing protein [Spirochaetaceae bacterium]
MKSFVAALLVCLFSSIVFPLCPLFAEKGDADGFGILADRTVTLPPGDAERGKDLTVRVAVIGPGTELYFWWGHIGLQIEDAATGENKMYDWGAFSFDAENFYLNFAMGRLRYTCTVSSAERVFRYMTQLNRSITLYTLDLPPETKDAIRKFAEWNVRPGNKDYWYHHFKDNCATRVRDIIGAATGGEFKQQFGTELSNYTLRQHIRRYMYFNPFFDWLLNFWMGRDIDRPITVWQEMFLPDRIGFCLENSNIPLVTKVEVLYEAKGRPPILDAPPRAGLWELGTALVLCVILIIFRKKRIFIGVTQSVLGLFFGFVGLILFILSFFTNHDYTYHNMNLLYVNPLFLALVPLGIMQAIGGAKALLARKIEKWFWLYVLVAGLIVQLLNLIPALYQANYPTALLVLPLALCLFFLNGLQKPHLSAILKA